MKKLLYTVSLLIFSNNALAHVQFYSTLGAGWTVPSHNSKTIEDSGYAHYGPTAAPSGESIFNLPAVNWENDYKNGFNLNAAIGCYLFPSIRADLEFLYQGFKRDIVGTYGWAEYDALSAQVLDTVSGIIMTPTSSFTNVYTVLTNGYYDFHNKTKWTPMLGAGFGIAWLKSSATSANGQFGTPSNPGPTPTLQMSQKLTGTALAWQLKGGVAYEYNSFMSFILQYRFFSTTKFIAERSSITTNPNATPYDKRIFSIGQQTLGGLVTNSLEMQVKFRIS